jgi:serine/threonine protein kinase
VLYLKELGWVHRDLKDENIVVDENYRIKLVDFGSAARIPTGANKEDRLFKQFNGTLAFAAPEIIKGHWYAPLDAEVWTLGILLFTLAYKKAPFQDISEIREKMPEELETDDLSGINDLIRSMLEKRPSARIHIESIPDHRWMRKCQRLYGYNSQ